MMEIIIMIKEMVLEAYYNSGDKYIDGWINDKKFDKGVYYYNSGDKYDGEFKNDLKNGNGIFF